MQPLDEVGAGQLGQPLVEASQVVWAEQGLPLPAGAGMEEGVVVAPQSAVDTGGEFIGPLAYLVEGGRGGKLADAFGGQVDAQHLGQALQLAGQVGQQVMV